MTDRERWTVYPLLLLSLGLSLRDKLFSSVDVAEVRCRRLTVAGADDVEHVRLGKLPGGAGGIEVCDRGGEIVVSLRADDDRCGTIETFRTYASGQLPLVTVGHDAQNSGEVVTHDPRGRPERGSTATRPPAN